MNEAEAQSMSGELAAHANFAPPTGDVVRSDAEAEKWFKEHAKGSVTCVNGKRELVARFYQEAKQFFRITTSS